MINMVSEDCPVPQQEWERSVAKIIKLIQESHNNMGRWKALNHSVPVSGQNKVNESSMTLSSCRPSTTISPSSPPLEIKLISQPEIFSNLFPSTLIYAKYRHIEFSECWCAGYYRHSFFTVDRITVVVVVCLPKIPLHLPFLSVSLLLLPVCEMKRVCWDLRLLSYAFVKQKDSDYFPIYT